MVPRKRLNITLYVYRLFLVLKATYFGLDIDHLQAKKIQYLKGK